MTRSIADRRRAGPVAPAARRAVLARGPCAWHAACLMATRLCRASMHREGRHGMRPIDKLRQMLLAQRRALFEQVARAADDLRWLDTNTHPETEEEAQEQNIANLLARLDDRGNGEVPIVGRAL